MQVRRKAKPKIVPIFGTHISPIQRASQEIAALPRKNLTRAKVISVCKKYGLSTPSELSVLFGYVPRQVIRKK
jgi:hypothetical protein